MKPERRVTFDINTREALVIGQAVWPSWSRIRFPIWRPGFESGRSEALTVKNAIEHPGSF